MTPTGGKYILVNRVPKSQACKGLAAFCADKETRKLPPETHLGFFFQLCLSPLLGNELCQVNEAKRHLCLKV
jgi:hypothetical protein